MSDSEVSSFNWNRYVVKAWYSRRSSVDSETMAVDKGALVIMLWLMCQLRSSAQKIDLPESKLQETLRKLIKVTQFRSDSNTVTASCRCSLSEENSNTKMWRHMTGKRFQRFRRTCCLLLQELNIKPGSENLKSNNITHSRNLELQKITLC